jgi:predicted dehydrogenase
VVSQVSLGRKNQLALCVDTLWIGERDHSTLLPRASAAMTPGATHHSRLPAGHPQGYQDCFDALVRDFYAHVQGRQVPAHPTFTDGLRAARITAAVLTSARSGQWVDVN